VLLSHPIALESRYELRTHADAKAANRGPKGLLGYWCKVTLPPNTLRLLADDLTGALDTAAELAGLAGPVPTFWQGSFPERLPSSAALDSGTRERPAAEATAIVTDLARLMVGADIAYKKIDSLLRGPALAELAAVMRTGIWRSCVLAPAFPYQGRITRDGRQYVRHISSGWSDVTGDIIVALRHLGMTARTGLVGEPLPDGISVFDALTEDDLQLVSETGRLAHGPVLWCGSGGLAQALASGAEAAQNAPLPGPILGLFGSDQQITALQLAACDRHWIRLSEGECENAFFLPSRLRETGAVLVSLDLVPKLPRDVAARRIRASFNLILRTLELPGTLLVAGGETLRGIVEALSAESLEVQGRIVPGLPRSILRGGRWDGITVVSKSGGFGPVGLLRDLLRGRFGSSDGRRIERTG
jgi:uncharacterized protein YgbK (DUF1537 family)